MIPAKPPKMFILISIALLITILQTVIALGLSPPDNLSNRYMNLYKWDSVWYDSIMTDGYHSSIPPVKWQIKVANVAFFPGYPLFGRIVMHLTNELPQIVLPLAAQLAAVGFWAYVLILSGVGLGQYRRAAVVVTLIASFPTAFYLIAGYSESLFLMSSLGFFYWSQRPGRQALVLAVLHGFVMTSTRIVGLPIAGIPLLLGLVTLRRNSLWRGNWTTFASQYKKNLLVSLLSMLGCMFFFLYCHLKFGIWNLYVETQRIGWGITANFAAPFSADSYRFFAPCVWTDANCLSLSSVPVIMVVLVITSLYLLWVQLSHFRRLTPLSLSLLLAAWGSFLIGIIGLANLNFISMIRYNLPVFVFLSLALVSVGQLPPKVKGATSWLRLRQVAVSLLAAVATIIMAQLQLMLFNEFVSGRWVS